MTDQPTPDGMRRKNNYPSIIPYLMVADGTGLIGFLEQGFGGRREFVVRTPANGIMHAEIEVGDGMLMLSDATDQASNPAHLCLYVADVDAIYATAIGAGATNVSVPETKAYGDRVAGIRDPAGNTWWICARLA